MSLSTEFLDYCKVVAKDNIQRRTVTSLGNRIAVIESERIELLERLLRADMTLQLMSKGHPDIKDELTFVRNILKGE
jgi:hypothetical protein